MARRLNLDQMTEPSTRQPDSISTESDAFSVLSSQAGGQTRPSTLSNRSLDSRFRASVLTALPSMASWVTPKRQTDDSHFPPQTDMTIGAFEPMVWLFKDYKDALFREVWLRAVESTPSAFAAPLASNMVSQGQPFDSTVAM